MPVDDAAPVPGGDGLLSRAMRLKRRFAPEGSFARGVLTLMTGTAFAQAIPIAAAPILTRLYGPQDFGVLALYIAATTVVATAATASYACAIILPEKEEDAADLLALSVAVAVALGLATLLAVSLFNAPIARLLGNPGLARWLYFLPLSVLTVSVLQALNFWAMRKRQYRLLATRQVAQSAVMVGTQACLGLTRASSIGMVAGLIAGQGASTGLLAGRILKEDGSRLRGVRIAGMRAQARLHYRFLAFSAPSALVNAAARNAPVVLLSVFFGPLIAGLFALTHPVVAVPLDFFTASIRGVFMERASRDFNRLGNCAEIYDKTLKALFAFGLPPTMLFAAAGPRLFALVFGPQWEEAGRYAQILSVMYYISFLAQTVSCVIYIAGKQHQELAWNAATFTATAGSICVGGLLGSPKASIVCYAVARSIMYAAHLYMSYSYSRGKPGPA